MHHNPFIIIYFILILLFYNIHTNGYNDHYNAIFIYLLKILTSNFILFLYYYFTY
jgi:hypothetical protein